MLACVYIPGRLVVLIFSGPSALHFYLYCPADVFVSCLILLCLSALLIWFLQGYIDKCEDWLAEAVQGSANPKSVAVHIMVLAHYWEYQVVLLLREGRHCGLLHASETAFLQQISKIQLRIRGLAEQLQDLLPPSWMPAVVSLHKIHLPQCA